jgi:hypothetical protein
MFTLEAAFTALSKAASAENIIKGTNALAANIGQSGPQILASIQSITQGQLTLAQAAENTNIALSAGFNTDQIEKLNRVAMGASQALGRDLTDSVTRLTKGTAKLEPELLDELGIFTRIDPAVQAYAKSMNISANSLTNFEKRQAFANAVIEEGIRKFSAIDVSAPSAQKSLNQLSVEVQQLATEFLQLITGVLLPLVNFFKGDIGNSLLLFGGILALVFGKGIGIVKDWASSSLGNLSTFAGELSRISEQVKGNFAGMTTAVTAFNTKMASEGGLSGKASNLLALNPALAAIDPNSTTGKSKAETLAGTGGATQLVGAGAKTARTDYIAARDRFTGIAAGRVPDLAQRTKDLATFNAALARLDASGKRSTLIFERTSAMVTTLTASINGASTSARVFAGAATFMAGAAKFASFALTGLNIALGLVMTVVTVAQLAGSLLGVDYLGKLRDKISGVTQATENLKAGFVGLITAAAGGGDVITQALKAAGASDKDLEKTNDRLIALGNSITTKGTREAATAIIKEQESASFLTKLNNLFFNVMTSSKGANTMVELTAMTLDDAAIAGSKLAAVTDMISDKQLELATATGTNRSELEQDIILLTYIKKAYEDYGTSLGMVIGTISRLTGIDQTSIAEIFSNKGGNLIDSNYIDKFDTLTNSTVNVSRSLTAMGMVLMPLTDGTYSFADMTADQIQYMGTAASLVNTLNSVYDGFTKGNITVDEMAAKLFGAKSAYDELAKSAAVANANNLRVKQQIAAAITGATTPAELNAAVARQTDYYIAVAEANTQMAIANNLILEYQGNLAKFKLADNVLSTVQSAFSGQIGEVDKANMSGLVSLSGKLADNADEQRINQTEILSSIIKQDTVNQNKVKQAAVGLGLTGEELRIQEASVAAKKAFTGQLIQDYQETTKLLQAEQKRTIELQNQLALLKQQSAINLMAAGFKLAATNAQNTISSQERGIQLQQTNLDNLTAGNSLELQRFKNLNEIANIEAEIANIRGSGNAAADAAALQAIKNQTKLNTASRQLVVEERDVTTTRAELEDKKRANLELEKQVLIDNYNMQKKAIEASGGGNAAATKAQLDALDRQKLELEKQAAMLAKENIAKLAIFDKETQLQKDKIQADITKLKNDQSILDETRKLDRLRLDAQVIATNADNQILQNQLKGYQSFATSVNGMLDASRTFAESISSLLGYLGGDTGAIQTSIANLPQKQTDTLTELQGTIKTNIDAQNTLYGKQYEGMDALAAIEDRNYRAQLRGLEDQLTDVDTLRQAQRDGIRIQNQAAFEEIRHNIKMIDLQKTKIELEGKAGGSNTSAQLDQLKAQLQQDLAELGYSMEDLGYESSILAQTMISVKDNVRTGIVSGLMDLNNALYDTADDTKSFAERVQDAFSKLMMNIQQTVFEKTIANPIGNFIADWVGKNILGKIISISTASTMGDNVGAAAIGGVGSTVSTASAGATTAINTAAASLGSALSNLGLSVGGSAQTAGIQAQAGGVAGATAITGSGTALAGATTMSTGAVATANTAGASTLMSSLGPILAVLAVIAAIMALFGGKKGGASKSGIAAEERAKALAQSNTNTFGAIPRMASGGMMRDRVPALLEPGEFVIRKPIARKIGASNLAQMNATGNTGSTSAPTINIKNEGSPKTAESSPPRFDGEKYVIDVIMRDLSTNGPIRRSLRGGAL